MPATACTCLPFLCDYFRTLSTTRGHPHPCPNTWLMTWVGQHVGRLNRLRRRLVDTDCVKVSPSGLCASAGTGLDEEDVVDKKTREVDGRTVSFLKSHTDTGLQQHGLASVAHISVAM